MGMTFVVRKTELCSVTVDTRGMEGTGLGRGALVCFDSSSERRHWKRGCVLRMGERKMRDGFWPRLVSEGKHEKMKIGSVQSRPNAESR
mmetsp:Transcript_15564/g.31592  ORF Transcript_15564/g.31592 Transcript_15564/m.31592 type:complete len:89 (+) Transcript_15564:54-320(+)